MSMLISGHLDSQLMGKVYKSFCQDLSFFVPAQLPESLFRLLGVVYSFIAVTVISSLGCFQKKRPSVLHSECFKIDCIFDDGIGCNRYAHFLIGLLLYPFIFYLRITSWIGKYRISRRDLKADQDFGVN